MYACMVFWEWKVLVTKFYSEKLLEKLSSHGASIFNSLPRILRLQYTCNVSSFLIIPRPYQVYVYLA